MSWLLAAEATAGGDDIDRVVGVAVKQRGCPWCDGGLIDPDVLVGELFDVVGLDGDVHPLDTEMGAVIGEIHAGPAVCDVSSPTLLSQLMVSASCCFNGVWTSPSSAWASWSSTLRFPTARRYFATLSWARDR